LYDVTQISYCFVFSPFSASQKCRTGCQGRKCFSFLAWNSMHRFQWLTSMQRQVLYVMGCVWNL